MSGLLLAVAGEQNEVEHRVIWARAAVRIAPAEQPGWLLLDVAGADQGGLERVAEEVTTPGPGVLVVVAEWRTAVQVWADGRRLLTVDWVVGEVNGRDLAEAQRVADALAPWFAVDRQAMIHLLRSPVPADRGWREFVRLLAVPVPAAFPEGGNGSLETPAARVLERRSFLDAMDQDSRLPVPSAPDRDPEPAWKLVGRGLLVLVWVGLVVWAAATGRVLLMVGSTLGLIGLTAGFLQARSKRTRANPG